MTNSKFNSLNIGDTFTHNDLNWVVRDITNDVFFGRTVKARNVWSDGSLGGGIDLHFSSDYGLSHTVDPTSSI